MPSVDFDGRRTEFEDWVREKPIRGALDWVALASSSGDSPSRMGCETDRARPG